MEAIPQKQPQRGLPWTLRTAEGEIRPAAWEHIKKELDRLHVSDGGDDSFMILEQEGGKDYWYIQSAIALKGPHAGQYIVGCGWSGAEGPSTPGGIALVEWYGDYDGAAEKFRQVWETGTVDFTGFEDQSYLLPANQRKERLAIACRVVGELGVNCYFITDRIEGRTAVIDPGGSASYLIEELKKLGTQVQYLLLTHGHYDHTGAVPELLRAFPEAEVYIHPRDYPGPDSQLFPLYGLLGGMDCPNIRFYRAFNDRDVPTPEARELSLGGLTIHPIHTPGHSEGSVTLRITAGGPLFCGDALFEGSCGRTDFPGGNVGKMMSTLRMFGRMEGDAQVFPGHMGFTTLDEERAHNPYLRQALQETP